MIERAAEIAIIIVGFRNANDIKACLSALLISSLTPEFDVFIAENGGLRSYQDLLRQLVDPQGPCTLIQPEGARRELRSDRFIRVQQLEFKTRSSRIFIGCAAENLGYAGGINAWLIELLTVAGWKAVWILNPDTEPAPTALNALAERAENGKKAMVGSTILEPGSADLIRFRGGLRWQTFAARATAVGIRARVGEPFDLHAVEESLDAPSGASTYVTRQCIEKIGLMDDDYFLFFEDLDWGRRAKKLGLGYASDSIVAHRRGTTTGSGNALRCLSRLAVYLEHRNAIHFVRKHVPWTMPVRILVSSLHAVRFLICGAPRNCIATLEGMFAGLRGEIGQPHWHRETLLKDEKAASASVSRG
jgi:GT2 family glycosyltransferase